MTKNLKAITEPKSIVVIGASAQIGHPGNLITTNLLARSEFRFTGQVHLVNEVKAPEVEGYFKVKCYRSVSEIEGDIDLAIIVVPATYKLTHPANQALIDCGKKKVKGAVIITAGFKEVKSFETNPDGSQTRIEDPLQFTGVEREKELLKTANENGITVVGPNCLGVLNTDPKTKLNCTFAPELPQGTGVIGFASQSGALCSGILNVIPSLNVGLRQLVSLGNQVQINAIDLLSYWKEEQSIEQALFYLESMENPAKFLSAARDFTAKKPIIAVKSGRSQEGARAASSHTGSLSSGDSDIQALMDSAGVIREDGIRAMFNTATMFEKCPVPQVTRNQAGQVIGSGRRVGIVTNTGGLGVLATDILVKEGLELATFTPMVGQAINKVIDDFKASSVNPVDTIASISMEKYAKTVDLVASDDNVDIVMALFIYLYAKNQPESFYMLEANRSKEPSSDLAILAQLNRIKAKYPNKPIVGVFMTTEDLKQRLDQAIAKREFVAKNYYPDGQSDLVLLENNVPFFNYVDEAVLGLKRLVERMDYLESLKVPTPVVKVDYQRAKNVIDRAKVRLAKHPEYKNTITNFESMEIFRAYGMPVPDYVLVTKETELEAAIKQIGYPCVLKISGYSEVLSHKSDVKGVKLNIKDEKTLHDEYHKIIANMKKINLHGQDYDETANIEGVVVMKQVSGEREFIMGTKAYEDAQLLMFGLGGVLAEAIKEVSFVAMPLNNHSAQKLISNEKVKNLLGSLRNNEFKAVNQAELLELFFKIDKFITDFPEVREMDLNPFKVSNDGELLALDARIALK